MQFYNLLLFTYSDYPRPWQISFQKPATTMMEGIIDLHHDIFTFLVIILIFVSFLLGSILYRSRISFDQKRSRIPVYQYQNAHGITHNTTLEIVWTIIPTLVLLLIATPSFALIYALDEIVEPELTIRVVGRQWYWTYEFPDTLNLALLFPEKVASELDIRLEAAAAPKNIQQIREYSEKFPPNLDVAPAVTICAPGFSFNSYIVASEDLFPGSFRLLETDRRLVLPSGINIRVLVTSYDVIHSWTVPSFGIKVDALPGRLNEYYLNINYLGLFYGQCSEICGVNHGFMPIKVEVTTVPQFCFWFLQTSLLENNPIKFRNSIALTALNNNDSTKLTLVPGVGFKDLLFTALENGDPLKLVGDASSTKN